MIKAKNESLWAVLSLQPSAQTISWCSLLSWNLSPRTLCSFWSHHVMENPLMLFLQYCSTSLLLLLQAFMLLTYLKHLLRSLTMLWSSGMDRLTLTSCSYFHFKLSRSFLLGKRAKRVQRSLCLFAGQCSVRSFVWWRFLFILTVWEKSWLC